MPELSIIVPVYNVEEYLHQCIESILQQSFVDFELILVDDGSTDKSGIICDTFANRDNRVIVIHQKNSGVSSARNNGLENAKGTFIGFVDADDWIDPCMYFEMMNTMKQRECDVVICNFYNDDQPRQTSKGSFFLDSYHLLFDLFSRPSACVGTCWNKLYRRELVSEIRFLKDLKMWEDLVFLTDLYLSSEIKAYLINIPLYHYRNRDESATKSAKRFFGQNVFRTQIMEKLLCYNTSVVSQAIEFYLDSLTVILQKKLVPVRFRLYIKLLVIYWLFFGRIRKLLPKHIINRYFIEGVIRS